MIKAVVHEPSFCLSLELISGFHCGVLLSGTAGNEEHLFLPIEVPPKEDTDQYTADLKAPRCIADIDGSWVASHCRNLNRMIPGGVRISGLCLTAALSEFTSEQEHLRKVLQMLPAADPIIAEIIDIKEKEKLILLCDPQTKKLTCKILDVSSSTSHFRSVNVRSQTFINSYSAFRTNITLSMETVLPTDRQKEEILLQLQAAVKPYLHCLLKESNLLINGEFRSSDEPVLRDIKIDYMSDIVSPTRRKKSAKSSKRRSVDVDRPTEYRESGDFVAGTNKRPLKGLGLEKATWADVELTVFGSQFPRWQRASSSSSLDSGTSSDTGYTGGTDRTESSSGGFIPVNRLIVNGCIPGIAFLPSNVTVGELFAALRKDMIQSILARLELLTEELHITSAELEVPRMLLPQRVLVRLPACPSLPLSDYKFLSETADDVISRLHYFCIPLGVRGSGDADEFSVERLSSSERPASLESLSSGITSASSRDLLDASCLDTSLEQSPDVNVETEYSETELLENVAQSVQPVARYLFLSSSTVLIFSSLVVVIGILAAYVLFGST